MCAAVLRAVHAVCREGAQKRLKHAGDTGRDRHNTLAGDDARGALGRGSATCCRNCSNYVASGVRWATEVLEVEGNTSDGERRVAGEFAL